MLGNLKMRPVLGLVVFVALCLGAAALGAALTTPEIDGWYRTIRKPAWNPPDAVFGPVWTTLYVLMALAAWLIWRPRGVPGAALPLALFALQLTLNVAWSWIFFGLHRIGAALLEMGFLWVAIAVTTAAFRQRSRLAAWLMAPYLLWVSFAFALNFTIWRLN